MYRLASNMLPHYLAKYDPDEPVYLYHFFTSASANNINKLTLW